MKNSYKKRLYTQALSLSAAVLLAALAQGNAAADTLNPAEPPQDSSKISTLVEQPKPASTEKAEETSTIPQAEPLDKSRPSEAADSKAPSLPSTALEEKKLMLAKNWTPRLTQKSAQLAPKKTSFSLLTVRFTCPKKPALKKLFKNRALKLVKSLGH